MTLGSGAGNRRVVVAVTLLAGVIAAAHVGKLPPALPSIRAQFRLDIVEAGWLTSTFSAVGAAAAIFLGAVADRLNHWRLAVGGLALMALSGFAGSFAASAPQLLLSRFLEGLGFLAVAVAAPSIIARATSGRARRVALGFWAGYLPAGVSLMILAAPLALEAGGWRALWIAVALLAMSGAALMWACGRGAADALSSGARLAPWHNIGVAVSRPGPWLAAGCFALYAAQLYAVITWMPTFMIDERGIGPALAAALTAVAVAGNGSANLLGGWLLHRGASPSAMMAISGAAMAVFALGMFALRLPDAARYACCIVLCGAGGVVASAAFAAAPAFAPSPAQLGVVNGMLVQASNLAQFIGPTAAAASVAAMGRWEGALGLFIGANALLILLALLLLRQEKTAAARGGVRVG